MMHRYNHGDEYWVLPGGGVEEGESFEEAALRELREEMSIEGMIEEKLTELTDRNGGKHVIFLCKYVSGEAKLGESSEEAKKFSSEQKYIPEWIEAERLPDLTFYPVEAKELLHEITK